MARTATSATQSSPRVAAAGAAGHWSAEGGTPVVVAQGETAALLSTRYGVPTDALLRANGFNVASQVQPGSRLVIPVYRAGGAPVMAARVPAAPAKAAAAAPAEIKPVAAKSAALAKPVAAAKPAEPAKPLRKAEAEPAKAKPAEKTKTVAKAAPEKTLKRRRVSPPQRRRAPSKPSGSRVGRLPEVARS